MQVNHRELAAGLVFVAIGGFFALNALVNLRLGSTLSMGPGYFPVMLGTILVALGIAIALAGIARPREVATRVPWRGLVLVIGSIVLFGATTRGLGFAPALAASVFMAAMSSGRLGWRAAAVLSLVLTLFCIAVFVWALALPYPLLGRWIAG